MPINSRRQLFFGDEKQGNSLLPPKAPVFPNNIQLCLYVWRLNLKEIKFNKNII
jgi:hypothetical protein